jgi:hypothetical protein
LNFEGFGAKLSAFLGHHRRSYYAKFWREIQLEKLTKFGEKIGHFKAGKLSQI